MKLRNKITIGIITAASIPLLLLVAFSVVKFTQLKLQDTIDALGLHLNNEAAQLSSYFAVRKAEVATLSEASEVQSMEFTHMRPLLMSELQRLKSAYEKFIVGHPAGYFNNTSGGNAHQDMFRTFDDADPNAKKRSIAKRDYWQNTVGKNTSGSKVTTVSEPMISYTTEVKQVVVASSVMRDGQVMGMLGGALPWKNIEALILDVKNRLEMRVGEGARMFLVSPSGIYWYHWQPEKVVHYKKDSQGRVFFNEIGEKVAVRSSLWDEEFLPVRKQANKILSEHSGFVDIPSGNGHPAQYLLFSRVEASGYVLGLFVPKTIVADSVDKARVFLIGLAVAVLLLLVATSYWLGYRISKPIVQLSQVTEAIRLGKPVTKLEGAGSDEIGVLTKDVFAMLDVLQANEKALKKSDERFSLAMAGANDGLWDWNIQQNEVYYSPRWKSMLGYEPGELGSDFSVLEKLIAEEDKQRFDNALKKLFQGQDRSLEIEFKLKHKLGHRITVLSRAYLVRNSEGKPQRLVGTHVDITDRKKQEAYITQLNEELEARVRERTQELDERNEQLQLATQASQEASKAKSQFLAKMSHELRTPLNSIIGFNRRMKKYLDGGKSDRLLDAIDTVDRNASHLLNLINQILDFSKIEQGKMELNKETCDLGEIIEECVESMRPIAEQKDLQLETQLEFDEKVVVDKLQVKQVVINLLSNALKFTMKGEVMCRLVSAELFNKPAVCIEVVDSGIGIAEQELDLLFQKFTQIHRKDVSPAIAGTGLGLSISQEIVQLHGGKIEVQSELDKGSCFRVLLPIDE